MTGSLSDVFFILKIPVSKGAERISNVCATKSQLTNKTNNNKKMNTKELYEEYKNTKQCTEEYHTLFTILDKYVSTLKEHEGKIAVEIEKLANKDLEYLISWKDVIYYGENYNGLALFQDINFEQAKIIRRILMDYFYMEIMTLNEIEMWNIAIDEKRLYNNIKEQFKMYSHYPAMEQIYNKRRIDKPKMYSFYNDIGTLWNKFCRQTQPDFMDKEKKSAVCTNYYDLNFIYVQPTFKYIW